MEKLDLLGLPIEEALDILKAKSEHMSVEIEKTFAWNQEKEFHLDEARVLKTLRDKDKITVIIGYF